ncbi:hypothetical protein OS493_038824, partial [Desmophyllum pertusum]
DASWYKVNLGPPVCFEARNNRPGHVTYRGSQGMLLGALKLVYKEGAVRCVSNVAYNSRWGCHGYSSLKAYPLNVIITDKHNNVIFPLPQFIQHNAGLWYDMPVVDDKYSDELVFSNFDVPLYLQPHMELRIWFGEDLKNWSETDNQGRVCVDVMGYVIGDVGGAGGASGGGTSKAQALLKDLKASLSSIMQKSWK